MRLTPWRAMPPKDAISGLDRDRLEKRLANPLLRDERVELTINEMRRAWHERTRKPY